MEAVEVSAEVVEASVEAVETSTNILYLQAPVENIVQASEIPLQFVSSDLQDGRWFRYFGSCWDQSTGEDPTLTLILTLTPNRSQHGPKLAINAAAPR